MKEIRAMANSPLAGARYPAHTNNYWGNRQGIKIDRIIIHHMAATWTAKRCCESFQDPNRGASSNYCIGVDGEIAVSVDEVFASGASSNRDADMHGITIETANSEMGGQWKVSDATLNSLIRLCADIAKRNGLGKLVKGKNLCWHQMYAATACPGEYLLSKMDYICNEANKINYPEKSEQKEVKIVGITGINSKSRGTNELILITDGRATTGFNKWGVDVIVNSSGKIIEVYNERANSPIPKNCICLSGHNAAGYYLLSHCKVGQQLKIG